LESLSQNCRKLCALHVNIAAADKRRGRHAVAIERSAVLKIFCCSPTIIPVMDDN
jgi:hypothetical protein